MTNHARARHARAARALNVTFPPSADQPHTTHCGHWRNGGIVSSMFGKIERKDALNLSGAFLAAYGWLAFFCFFYLMMRWEHSAPTSPDPARGYIYSHDEHGWITYFSAFQTTSCALLFFTSIPLFFVGVLMIPKRNVAIRHGFLSIGANWDADDPKKLRRIGLFLGAAAAPIIVFIFGPVLVSFLNEAGLSLRFQ